MKSTLAVLLLRVVAVPLGAQSVSPRVTLQDDGARAKAWMCSGRSAHAPVEFGPLSEASIGNVGMQPETTGCVNHVVTPVGAFGLIVAEDALDSLRLIFNPARTLSNAVGGHLPWYRRDRSLSWSSGPIY